MICTRRVGARAASHRAHRSRWRADGCCPRPCHRCGVAGLVDQLLGVAIDIGSTTIAGHLVDLSSGDVLAAAGRMNPQIRYGEDLMSRVSYAMMNPGGATALTAAVQFELDTLVSELVEEAGVDRASVVDIVVVGNPVMHHLVLGLDPAPLGQAPFTLATSDAVVARHRHRHRLSLGPGICRPVHRRSCGRRHRRGNTCRGFTHAKARTCCSSMSAPTRRSCWGTMRGSMPRRARPARRFEGAQLSCGQRATTRRD
jgi:hypothetical protein